MVYSVKYVNGIAVDHKQEILEAVLTICEDHKLTFIESEKALDHVKSELKNHMVICKKC